MSYEVKLFCGNANRPLAEEIAQHLDVRLGDADVSRFSDGEVYVQINENVRGEDVFIVQPTCPPVNDTLMELLVMIDAFKRASARRITAVLPYYGYGRQDRKSQSRVPISAKLVADLITTAGASRVLAIDLHAGQIQGFFNIPVDHLFAAPVIIDYLAKKALEAVKREGARRVLACGVHPVLSGPAISRIAGSDLEELIITNSIPLPPEKRLPNVHVLSVAPLLGEAIRRIHDEESVSTLFV